MERSENSEKMGEQNSKLGDGAKAGAIRAKDGLCVVKGLGLAAMMGLERTISSISSSSAMVWKEIFLSSK